MGRKAGVVAGGDEEYSLPADKALKSVMPRLRHAQPRVPVR